MTGSPNIVLECALPARFCCESRVNEKNACVLSDLNPLSLQKKQQLPDKQIKSVSCGELVHVRVSLCLSGHAEMVLDKTRNILYVGFFMPAMQAFAYVELWLVVKALDEQITCVCVCKVFKKAIVPVLSFKWSQRQCWTSK